MLLCRLPLKALSLSFIAVFSAYASAPSFLDRIEEEPFKAALVSFQNLRTSHPQLKSLPKEKPTCFISYAWGVSEQERTVHTLASNLRDAGINVLLDIWHNKGGTSTIQFAQKILDPQTDFIILCGSEKLMEKLDEKNENDSVVRVEVLDLIGRRVTWARNKRNIIPILLEGRHEDVLPPFLWSIVSIGFQKKEDYCLNCFSLLNQLYKLEHGDSFVEQIIKNFKAYRVPPGGSSQTPEFKLPPHEQGLPSDLLVRAKAGDPVAQTEIAFLYQKGETVVKNEAKAFEWFIKAADQGYTVAERNVGWMYLQGKEIIQDDTKAFVWYQKAALKGDNTAQQSIDWMRQNGRVKSITSRAIWDYLWKVKASSLSADFEAIMNSDPTFNELSLDNGNLYYEQEDELIGDKGAKAIAMMLEKNKTLTHLNLVGNSIDDEGIVAIASALEKNTTLTSLVLGRNWSYNMGYGGCYRNYIGPNGAKALAAALEINKTLTHLNLGWSFKTPQAAQAFMPVFKINKTLTSLILNDNDLGNEGIEILAEAIKQNASLTNIELGDNQIGKKGAQILRNLMQYKPLLKITFYGGYE